jgi:hypothetical protein
MDFRCEKTTRSENPEGEWSGWRYGSNVQAICGPGVRGGLAFFGSKGDNQWVLIDEVVFVFFRTDRFPWGPRATRNAGPHQA